VLDAARGAGAHVREGGDVAREEEVLAARAPRLEQRVDRQRDAGADLDEIAARRSKDYDKLIHANEGAAATLVIEDNKPMDWSVLMGTNDRKEKEKAGFLKKDDPTYDEVRQIASHCRGSDFPTPATLALLGDPASLLPPPKEPDSDDDPSFKKKISKLMQGLVVILENNAEKQVKYVHPHPHLHCGAAAASSFSCADSHPSPSLRYVSFKQRCNLHKKDLEGILARRALATMAYHYGAVNSPHLDSESFSSFLHAFWSENPHRFPVTEAEVIHLWQLCDAGDTALLSELAFVTPYIERNAFGFEFTQLCWGKPREGIMRLRSAGFEELITEDEIPARINYGYCKSTVAPPQDWDVGDIKKGMELPRSELELERVYGCIGKTICPNLYERAGDASARAGDASA
jgi:hypothetical protein